MSENTIELAHLTHPEVNSLDRDATVVLIPTGSIEQHGPHLPLDTDSFLATQVALAAARKAREAGPVLVTPTVCFGASEHHMAFPGTVTLDPATFIQAVKCVCLSIMRHGFWRVLIVNGHGGNTALLASAVQELGFEQPAHIAFCNYWDAARAAAEEIRESPPGGMGHACELETSLMLHLRPDSVRTDLIAREIPRPRYGSERLDLFHKGPMSAHWKTHELSESGVMGAPDLATADKGQRLFEAAMEGVAGMVEELASVS